MINNIYHYFLGATLFASGLQENEAISIFLSIGEANMQS